MKKSSKAMLLTGTLVVGGLAMVSQLLKGEGGTPDLAEEATSKVIRLTESDLRRDDVPVYFVEKDFKANTTAGHWPEQLPPMFRGTDVLGALTTDDQGNLVKDANARQLFDYFLTAQDDVDLTQIQQWLHQYIDQHLEAPADEQAYQLLGDYLEYKTQMNALSFDQDIWARLYDPSQLVSQSDLNSLRRVFQEREQLQQSLFDQTTAEAMFGQDNRYDQYMLDRMAVAASDLSEQEKQRQLQSLNARLPPESLRARQSSQAAIQHKSLTREMSDLTVHEKYQVYAQNYGDAAAERLMKLDQKRQAFQQKREQYLAFKAGLNDQQDQAIIDLYMKEQLSLSEGEIARMKTQDKIDARRVQKGS
ncbi:lipase secretion chaperone [Litoribacillus peritrichatus]|uniref:Lipase chaperone n=1 Tax=Litoribacillus peritrichatus TaxID=718191 RepID=A0ABP7MKC6_9GAMM